MTTPEQEAPPFDQGNQLLSGGPALITVSFVPTAAGQGLALTVRTSSTTLTVVLSKDEAVAWAGLIAGKAAEMSSSGLVISGPGVPLNGNGGPE